MSPPFPILRKMLETSMLAAMDTDHKADHDHGHLMDILAEDVHFEIVGEDTPMACKLKGSKDVQAMASSSEGQNISKIVDSSKPVHTEIVHLIGNEKDPWVAAALKQVGTSNTGKPFNHEYVILLEFNPQDKIKTMKIYADTAHLDTHASEHGLNV